MSAPTHNLQPQPQGNIDPYLTAGQMPPPPEQQPDPNQGQPGPNQQPQQDPNELRGDLAQQSAMASAEIQETVHEDYGRIGVDLINWKQGRKERLDAEGANVIDYFNRIKDDPNVEDGVKQATWDHYKKLEKQYHDFDKVDDKEHARTMLDERVDATRHEYAAQLAARRDKTLAIRTGRKKDMTGAKFEYDVAVAVRNNFVTEGLAAPDNASEKDKELAELNRNMAKLRLNLGKPGEDPETSQGESFKLARAERDARKLRSGRFEQDEQSGRVVEKQVGKVRKIRNAIEDKWAKWTEQSRSEKWSTRLGGRLKKVATLAVLGAGIGAAAGVTAGVVAGGAAALGASRAIKATAGVKLNQGAEILQADAHFNKVAALLDKKRDQYADALKNGFNVNGDGAAVMLSEQFSEGANTAHKKNFRSAAVTGVTTLLFGAGAGAVVHHAVGEFLGFGGDTVSAEDIPTNGNGGHMGGEDTGNGGSDTGEAGGNGDTNPDQGDTTGDQTPEDSNGDTTGGETTDNRADIPDNQRPEYPHDGGEADADTTPEDDTNTGTGEEQDNTPGHDPDEKPAEQQQKAEEDARKAEAEQDNPQAGPEQPAPSAEVTITPEQMDGKWVSQVYEDQLGEGGQAEMLSNAQDAVKAGELVEVQQPDGTFYYKLTEAGAAKLPGAGEGSTTTGDVMRILAGHSDKFTVA